MYPLEIFKNEKKVVERVECSDKADNLGEDELDEASNDECKAVRQGASRVRRAAALDAQWKTKGMLDL